MSTGGIAVNCTDDIIKLLRSTNQFGEKIFSVYSEEDLMDKTKLVTYPAIGIMYEGIRAGAGDPSGHGMAAVYQVAVVLLLDGKVLGIDMKNVAAEMLDKCRKAIRLKKSPSGHPWKFVQEVPGGLVHNLSLYIQRWQTNVILTSG